MVHRVFPLLVVALMVGQAFSPADSAASPHGAAGEDRPFDDSITTPELLEKAREAFGLGDLDLAEEFYQEILIRDRSNVQAMLELSNVYERGGKLEYARGLMVRAIKIQPGNEQIEQRLRSVERMLSIVLTEEVDSLFSSGKYELAIPKLSVQLSIEPGNARLFYRKAICYARLGRPDAALSDLDKALQIEQNEEYYRLRNDVLQQLHEKESRELILQAKRLIQSGTPEDNERAIHVLGEILQAEPENAWARTEIIRLSASAEPDTVEVAAKRGVSTASVRAVIRGAARTAVDFLGGNISIVLLLLITWLIFRSPLTRAIARGFSPRPILSGRLTGFRLSEILQMLNAEPHTGVLNVKGDSCRGKVYFESGEPCHCTVGKLEGVKALQHLLQHTSTGHFDFAEGSLPIDRSIDTPLGIILMRHGAGPGDGRRKSGDETSKSKSKMKELLENKSGR